MKQNSQRHANVVAKLKVELAETEAKNKELATTVARLTEQVDAIREEKERLNLTGELQGEEIKRLMEAEEGDEEMKGFQDSHQLLKLQERVNYLTHNFQAMKTEKERLEKEIEELKEQMHAVQKANSEEIESLKERETMLKKTNDQLEQGQERQRQANLDGSVHRKAEDGANNMENTLILEERVARAEQQMEKAQAERLLSIQESNKLKTEN